MKYLAAAFCLMSSFYSQASPVTEQAILGSYLLAPREPVDMEIRLSLPYYFTLMTDYSVDFVFDGEPSITSQCATNWSLTNTVLKTILDCTATLPGLKPIVIEFDLSDATEESLHQARGIETDAVARGLFGSTESYMGPIIL